MGNTCCCKSKGRAFDDLAAAVDQVAIDYGPIKVLGTPPAHLRGPSFACCESSTEPAGGCVRPLSQARPATVPVPALPPSLAAPSAAASLEEQLAAPAACCEPDAEPAADGAHLEAQEGKPASLSRGPSGTVPPDSVVVLALAKGSAEPPPASLRTDGYAPEREPEDGGVNSPPVSATESLTAVSPEPSPRKRACFDLAKVEIILIPCGDESEEQEAATTSRSTPSLSWQKPTSVLRNSSLGRMFGMSSAKG